VAKTLTLEQSFDTVADRGMTGRIRMDAVQQQLLIGPVGGPGAEELNIGDRFGGSGLLEALSSC
jgi:hypothetical protein